MNPALSLFIVYLKNYGSIAEAFNRRLATLPELYRKDILHAAPQDAVQDNVYAHYHTHRRGPRRFYLA